MTSDPNEFRRNSAIREPGLADMQAEQQALVLALLGRGEAPATLQAQPRGLAAYTVNLQVLSAQALAVPYGRLRDVLGEVEFAAMAWSFWRSRPPERGDLAQWGGALADWLLERAGADSGLPGLARVEWALHRAERVAELQLDAPSLQRLGEIDPERLELRFKPDVTLVELEVEAWGLLGEPGQGGHALVWRQGWRGVWRRMGAADAALMSKLLAGSSLGSALEAAQDQLARDSVQGNASRCDYDFAGWLARALGGSWLQSVELLA